MVDRADISELNDLFAELTSIEGAFVNLDAGGTIVAVTISGGPRNEMPYNPWATISTTYMDYPPQMIETIKTMMAERQSFLRARLRGMGLTGVE